MYSIKQDNYEYAIRQYFNNNPLPILKLTKKESIWNELKRLLIPSTPTLLSKDVTKLLSNDKLSKNSAMAMFNRRSPLLRPFIEPVYIFFQLYNLWKHPKKAKLSKLGILLTGALGIFTNFIPKLIWNFLCLPISYPLYILRNLRGNKLSTTEKVVGVAISVLLIGGLVALSILFPPVGLFMAGLYGAIMKPAAILTAFAAIGAKVGLILEGIAAFCSAAVGASFLANTFIHWPTKLWKKLWSGKDDVNAKNTESIRDRHKSTYNAAPDNETNNDSMKILGSLKDKNYWNNDNDATTNYYDNKNLPNNIDSDLSSSKNGTQLTDVPSSLLGYSNDDVTELINNNNKPDHEDTCCSWFKF